MDLGKVVGSGWYAGSTVPTSGSYVEGDFFFRNTDEEVFKYVSGAWVDQNYSIKGSKGDTGDPAGFGAITAYASSLAATQSPTAAVTAGGTSASKTLTFAFGIPKGADGVITASSGMFGFQVNSSGHLIMTYSGDTAPAMAIDTSGHLIYTY